MNKDMIFVVDAETDGLYGRFLSVAAVVENAKGDLIDSFYGALRVTKAEIENQWTAEHVFPHLGNAKNFYQSEDQLLSAFWAFWLLYRDRADCVAHIPYPVETRLFEKCIKLHLPICVENGPFPIYDLATLLKSRGYPFDADFPVLSGLRLVPHDAMNDALMEAAIWRKLFAGQTF